MGRILRGTAIDPFGWLRSRREERALVGWYREVIEGLLKDLDAAMIDLAVEIADVPRSIRGYEGVKRRSAEQARAWVDERLRQAQERRAA